MYNPLKCNKEVLLTLNLQNDKKKKITVCQIQKKKKIISWKNIFGFKESSAVWE